jgi:hypothetical protein
LVQLDNRYVREAVDNHQHYAKRLVEIVTAPRAGNLNLHAQSGVFTLFGPDLLQAGKKVDRRPLDEFLTSYESELISNDFNHPVFHHFTLPASNSRELLLLLERNGVSPAHLFPSFDGVARDVEHWAKLRSVWDSEDSTDSVK